MSYLGYYSWPSRPHVDIGLGIVGPTVVLTVFLVTLLPAARQWQWRLHYSALGWLTVYGCVYAFTHDPPPSYYNGPHVLILLILPLLGATVGLVLSMTCCSRSKQSTETL